jgi:S-adenosylmethionine:tRNA ribosyltransferase-isomerase
MKLSDFDYELPEDSIAQHPAARRDEARLLAHDLALGTTEHARVRDLARLLRPDDLVVVNDTRVIPARCQGRRASGGEVELLFLEPLTEERRWSALVHPARKLRPGERIAVEGGAFELRMVERRRQEDGTPDPAWVVELPPGPGSAGEDPELLERFGHVPLPPYIQRAPAELRAREDRERYQTVFAARPGAVAAPTAGLHFTPELLADLAQRGVRRASVTLHVGYGTFRPLKAEDVERERLHSERFELAPAVAAEVERARRAGGRVVAVGTTSARVLESCAVAGGRVLPRAGRTDLFLRPGSPFRVVDVLFTNFHLPRSSLLLLTCAFGGRERVLALYREALSAGYRFYSYGDALLLTGRARDA